MEYFSISMELDEKDMKILDILKSNAKLTTHKISKKLAIPITTVHNRIKKLEKLGIIKKYTVELDYKKLDMGLLAYITVTVTYTAPSGKRLHQEDIAKHIKKLRGVEEVDIVAGITDILVKVRLKDIDELNDFVIRKLREIEGVDKTQTLVVMSSV